MAPSPHDRCGQIRAGRAARALVAGLLSCLWLVLTASAQQPVVPVVPPTAAPVGPAGPVPREPPCDVPPVTVLPPKTAEAAKLVQSARCNDASIEVVAGQSRIVVVSQDLQTPQKAATLYVGDPNVTDVTFVPPPDPKVLTPRPALRILGKKPGITDLVILTPDDKIYKFEVRVVANPDLVQSEAGKVTVREAEHEAEKKALERRLTLINETLKRLYPDACLNVTMAGAHVVVEGEARNTLQVRNILATIKALMGDDFEREIARTVAQVGTVYGGGGLRGPAESPSESSLSRIINLIHVVGTQQVLLKVRVAELNRTAIRNIGADFLAFDKSSPLAIGTSLGNATISGSGILSGNNFNVNGIGASVAGTTTTFGIFSKADFEVFFNALRRNQLLKILAEPNLVAMNGQRANFLAGGQFFVPTPQTSVGGVAGGVTATPVDFGVRLDFLAHIIDGDLIRLTVDPEVSQPDFTVAVSLVPGGSPVPGLNKRSAHTTVELRQGQTLAIAGLMSVTLDGTTNRIPGLGDLPILGPFFSNTTGGRTEKELIVLVTPYLVEPMNPDQVPPSPGDEVKEPNDLEFYFLNRIEGRTGVDFRSTTHYDDAAYVTRCLLRLHEHNVRGPNGYCE
jgi:pilus assembly protein CpaC